MMENLEEVLQALDDFQKMRPTEIPRELEEYLSWVAKTGDPVYQWSLIKTLFREKLTRVMTDFYENCPTLELAPCPNVEHFNYDTMKTSLLERLESFANAPFTVQRICELLTAPRKEYNRVDKFMRAIEKNILVVSTREPGPIARRSENGDGMVNGSVDEDAPVTQPPQDVEMEYWEKDCASTVTISVHTVENEAPMLQTVIPTTTVVKNVFGTEEVPPEKLNSLASKSENSASTFIPSTPEFNPVTTIPSQQTQNQETPVPQAIQNLPVVMPEASGTTNDVPEAVMNEDTSSQPSLDMENEEGESIDCTKKLQTTFQAKDFTDNEPTKSYQEDNNPRRKTEEEAPALSSVQDSCNTEKSDDPVPLSPKSDITTEVEEPSEPPVENLFERTDEKSEENTKPNPVVEVAQSVIEPAISQAEKSDDEIFKDSEGEISSLSNGANDTRSEAFNSCPTEENVHIVVKSPSSPIILPAGDAVHRIPRASTPDIAVSENQSTTTVEQQDLCEDVELKEASKTETEEATPKDPEPEEALAINEEVEEPPTPQIQMDEPKVEPIVPDAAPVVEEPKESEPTKDQVTVMDIRKESDDLVENTIAEPEDEPTPIVVETTSKSEEEDSTNVNMETKENDSVIAETNGCEKPKEQTEMMDVDEEDTPSVFREEEPMEQETAEMSKS